jgi:hypothetical protein
MRLTISEFFTYKRAILQVLNLDDVRVEPVIGSMSFTSERIPECKLRKRRKLRRRLRSLPV